MKKRKKGKKLGVWCSKCGCALPGLCFGIISGSTVRITCRACGKINEIKF